MEDKICVDLFTDRNYTWLEQYRVKKSVSVVGAYYTITIDRSELKGLLKTARRHHIKYRWYEKRWSRASNYRSAFFKYYEPPYRCRYCNKKVTESRMVVDHVIPVAQVKKSAFARWLLTVRGIDTVNDPRNLAPSCRLCNLEKGDKMGVWTIRGIFGESKLSWIFCYAALALFIPLLVFLIYSLGVFSTIS